MTSLHGARVGVAASSPRAPFGRVPAVYAPSRAEERANSASHGLAAVAAVVGTPYLIVQAARQSDAAFVTAVCLFCAAMVILYGASALYHALPQGRAKRVFRMLDHSSIYLLIAGSYTPFTLGVLRGAWGWALFGIVWGLAALGIVLKSVGMASHPVVPTGLYLSMGWLVVIAIVPLFARVPLAGLLWLLAGGVFYTAGVGFFATDARLRYGHLAWHLFVIAGTVCHCLAILWYAA